MPNFSRPFRLFKNWWIQLCTGQAESGPLDEEHHRQTILVMTSSFWLLIVILLTLITPIAIPLTPEGKTASHLLFGVTGLGVLVSMLILRHLGNRLLALHILLIMYWGAFSTACLYFGGTLSPTFPLLLLAPVMASIAGSISAMIVWSSTVLLTWGALLIMERLGMVFEQIIAARNYGIALVLAYVAMAAAVVSIIVVYAESNKRLRLSLQCSNRDLELLSNQDPLTGLRNRRYYDLRLAQALERADHHGSELGLIIFDLNGFKAINDTFGHGIGDKLLQTIAERLRRQLRETDLVARIGGDEFSVILEDIHAREEVGKIAVKLARCIEKPIKVRKQTLEFSASFGLAVYPEHARTQATLEEQADRAMYTAKKSGLGIAMAD